MEPELTKEEYLNIFSQYPLCPIAIFEEGCEPVPDILEGIDFVDKIVIAERTTWDPKEIKLILINADKVPLPICLEIAKSFYDDKKLKIELFPIDGKALIEGIKEQDLSFHQFTKLINLLKLYKISLPTTFAVDHFAYGKTLFELGVAIEKQTD